MATGYRWSEIPDSNNPYAEGSVTYQAWEEAFWHGYSEGMQRGHTAGVGFGREHALEEVRKNLDLLVAQRDAELTPLYRALYGAPQSPLAVAVSEFQEAEALLTPTFNDETPW